MKISRFLSPKGFAAVVACLVLCASLFSLPSALAVPPASAPLDAPPPATAAPNSEEIRLTEEDHGRLAELDQDQTLVISLESNPSTGYSWQVEAINENVLKLVGETEFEQTSPLLGAPEKQILRFRPTGGGQSDLKLAYRRPWEKGVKPIKEYAIQVVAPPATKPEKGPTTLDVEESAHMEILEQQLTGDPKPSQQVEVQGSLTGWTNIMTEDFEGSFPGPWTLWNNGVANGEYDWGKRNCRPHSGYSSGWAVGGGADGGSLSCGDNYPYSLNSSSKAKFWMIYGPFDLSDASDAELLFWYWTFCESNYWDYLFWGASIDGSSFYGNRVSGDSGGWSEVNFDLTNVYSLGNLTGQPEVWIAFAFISDQSITYPEGAYVDDIVLRKVTGEPPAPTPTPTATTTPDGNPSGLPAAFDWRDYGGVTSVKSQGSCGSCWAFATVGPLEANIKIEDGVEKNLSEQYLVSCNTDGWGCSGGWWAHDYHQWKKPPSESEAGAVLEAESPYVASDTSCGGPYSHPYQIDSWTYVGSSWGVPSVEDIKQAIYDHGPVSVAVCVNSDFQYYTSGVFTGPECTDINHAVVLVGWNDADGAWILRNSWGSWWGESGYMRIAYGTSEVGYSANYVVYGNQSPNPTPTSTPTATNTPTPTSTPTATSTPTPTSAPQDLFGDLNGDCVVDVQDIQQVSGRWRCQLGDDCYVDTCDLDNDGDIDVVDIMLVTAHWGETC